MQPDRRRPPRGPIARLPHSASDPPRRSRPRLPPPRHAVLALLILLPLTSALHASPPPLHRRGGAPAQKRRKDKKPTSSAPTTHFTFSVTATPTPEPANASAGAAKTLTFSLPTSSTLYHTTAVFAAASPTPSPTPLPTPSSLPAVEPATSAPSWWLSQLGGQANGLPVSATTAGVVTGVGIALGLLTSLAVWVVAKRHRKTGRWLGGGGGGGEGDGRGGGVGGAMRSADSEATEVPQVKGVGGGREAMGKSAVNLGSSGSGAVREAGVGSTPAFVTSLHGGTPSSTTTRDGATGSATTPYTASPAGSNEKDDAMLPTSTAASPRNRTRRVFSAVAGGDPRMRLSMPPSDLPPCVRERLDAMRCEGVSSPTSSIRSTGGRARVPGAAGGGSLRASPKRRDTTTSCDGKRWSVGERSMTWEDGVGRVAGTPSWRARGASVFGAEFEGFEEVDGESVGGGGRWMGALGTLVPMTAPGTPEARAARAEGYVEPTERAMEEMPDFSNAGKKVVR